MQNFSSFGGSPNRNARYQSPERGPSPSKYNSGTSRQQSFQLNQLLQKLSTKLNELQYLDD